MANIDSLKIGTELDNAELQAIFKCSTARWNETFS